MLPGDTLSTRAVKAPYLWPDSLVTSADRDYEMGGIALNDPSMGLLYQGWEFWLESGAVYGRTMGDPPGEPIMLVAAPGASAVSGTFSRNMRPAVAWVAGGVGYLWWFDALANDMVTTEIPGVAEIRVAHDDKRPTADYRSDVIVAYTRAGNLYQRRQRDRYSVEMLLAENIRGQLSNLGMATNLRLVFDGVDHA